MSAGLMGALRLTCTTHGVLFPAKAERVVGCVEREVWTRLRVFEDMPSILVKAAPTLYRLKYVHEHTYTHPGQCTKPY